MIHSDCLSNNLSLLSDTLDQLSIKADIFQQKESTASWCSDHKQELWVSKGNLQ